MEAIEITNNPTTQTPPLKIFLLFSGKTDLEEWLVQNDPNYLTNYIFTGAFMNTESEAVSNFCLSKRIMLTYLGYDEYCTSQDYSPELDLSKELYFGLIASLVKAADADIIIGDAFDMAYPVSFIQQFPQKIIRVHEADLTQKNLADHTMLYAGPDAVQKAFANGEKHMRSTAYFLTPDAGTPKVICNSPPHYTDFHLSAEKNREIMKTVYNREAYKEALRKIYAGEVLLSGRKHSSKEK